MAVMSTPKKTKNQYKVQIAKEINYLKNVFTTLSIPMRMTDDDDEDLLYEGTNGVPKTTEPTNKRARSIAELEERLQKIKSEKNFNLKNKLLKKSLNSKISKKIKKKERLNKGKTKPNVEQNQLKSETTEKPSPNVAKPVFNNDGKLVFSKFDFANAGHKEKVHKAEKDPKKILENIERQEQRLKELSEREDLSKVNEVKEKISWKNVLQKAEGQKVKDDKSLLKKSIKKMEQKKKHSKKQWDSRLKKVEEGKEEKQKKRRENIMKKKKEKKSKIIKAATKRGRVVL